MAANTGVSCSHWRSRMAPKPNAPPARNGSRHQPPRISAGVKAKLSPMATSEPSRMPPVSPPVSSPTARPVRSAGTCSATNTQPPGASPPIAAPCISRMASSSSGASGPMAA